LSKIKRGNITETLLYKFDYGWWWWPLTAAFQFQLFTYTTTLDV